MEGTAGQVGVRPPTANSLANSGLNMAGKTKLSPKTKFKMYYVLVTSLVFAIIGALGYFIDRTSPQVFFAGTVALVFACGLLHYYLVNKWELYAEENKFSSSLLFTALLMFFGLIAYCIAFYFLSKKSAFVFVMPVSILLFIVPLWVIRTFDLALAVPAYDYKKWFFPNKPIVLDFDSIDTSNIAIITYVFSKKHLDTEISNFQTKAPYELRLGDLFYGFLQEWNYRNPQSTIEFMDENNIPYGWLFFVKKAWYLPKRYLDPDKTIKDNKISVNQIIITKRIQQEVES